MEIGRRRRRASQTERTIERGVIHANDFLYGGGGGGGARRRDHDDVSCLLECVTDDW